MTTFELPETELVSVALEPQERPTLGSAADEAQVHPDRVCLGLPICVPLDPASMDDDAKLFLAARPHSHFFLLSLRTSFAPDEEYPLASAWVDVTLNTDKPPGTSHPVAWSMSPLATTGDAVTVSRKVTLNASLKLTSNLLPIDVGPQAGGERTISHAGHAMSVEALREGTSRPRWAFFPSEVTQIRGTHRLSLVIDMPAGSMGSAKVDIGATIRLRRRNVFKVVRYGVPLQNLPETSVRLPPS